MPLLMPENVLTENLVVMVQKNQLLEIMLRELVVKGQEANK